MTPFTAVQAHAGGSLSEQVLLAFSRDPAGPDLPGGQPTWNEENALDLLRREFPEFDRRIAGRAVLDVGCGLGWQTVSMARAGAAFVLGIDPHEDGLREARTLPKRLHMSADRLQFASALPQDRIGRFDVAVSQNSFEHFGDPEDVLRQMASAVRPGGVLLITFGPPWLAPYGAHMFFFTSVPWVNLVFSERAVMRVRSRFRADAAERYEDVEGGLNKMTVARFEGLVRQCDLRLEWKRYRCVKGANVLARVPGVRELFINHVSCVLRKPPQGDGDQEAL